ncbi:hypothetical protein RL72_01579 [Microbacterium azadirachtae]|uniref:Uncharacterized protein n=1 Tax=Microbacterium azadirachtae TaxID=582680 RepID=A0A0F0KZY5_9MICO|nr:hypothetical protein [Microbacterium azadirachtae]KJL24856.1 hypothetical protein RL72_01579 [Microbacterium azadirachtae]
MPTSHRNPQPDLHLYNIRLRAELDEANASLFRVHRQIDERQQLELPQVPRDPRVVMRLEHLRGVVELLSVEYLELTAEPER